MAQVRDTPYYTQLDAVRAIAVLMVVMHHWMESASSLHLSGALGVGMFFVLSGFLITGILLRQQTAFQSEQPGLRSRILKTFYIRRTLRIFPIYYLYVLGLLILGIGQTREIWAWLLGYGYNFLLFLTNHWYSGYVEHLWSLAIEEQYYLIWPVLLLATPRRYTLALILSFIALGIVTKGVLYLREPASQYSKFPVCQFDAFGMGSLLAWLQTRGLKIKSAAVWMWACWITGLAFPLKWFPFHFQGMSLLGVVIPFYYTGCALFIHLASRGIGGLTGAIFNQPVVLYLGKISYGIYLYHLFVPDLVKHTLFKLGLGLPPTPILWVIYSLVTLGICTLSWKAIEQPINQLKDRFSYR